MNTGKHKYECYAVICMILYIVTIALLIATHCDKICIIEKPSDVCDIIMALSTFVAAVFAWLAFRHSNKMRQQASFDATFAPLLTGLQQSIAGQCNSQTGIIDEKIEAEDLFDIHFRKYSREANVFLNFCNIYKSVSNDRKYQKFDENEITELWRRYTDILTDKSVFLNSFKYIYHIVDEVINSPLNENEKRRYIGIVQAQLNLDVLFCYLINQIASTQGFESRYCKELKKYDFFGNLFDDIDGYGRYAKTTIPVYIYKYFTSKI